MCISINKHRPENTAANQTHMGGMKDARHFNLTPITPKLNKIPGITTEEDEIALRNGGSLPYCIAVYSV